MKTIFTLLSLFSMSLVTAQTKNSQHTIDLETNLIAMSSISFNLQTPMGEKSSMIYSGGFVVGTGFGYGSNGLKVEVGMLSYGPKHFLETSVLYLSGFEKGGSIGGKLGYRYQIKKRLQLLANIYLLSNVDPVIMPSIGVGYKL